MRKVILFGIFLCLYSSFVLAQEQQCPANSDKLYNRQTTLEQIAETLNESVPEYKQSQGVGFYVKNEKAKGFSIFDLTDPANTTATKNNDCINLVTNRVYHVYPWVYDFSFSHIMILENGGLKIFKSVNCQERGDSIEDVLAYLKQKLIDEKDKVEIMERVKNYRKYGNYPRICPMVSIQCN